MQAHARTREPPLQPLHPVTRAYSGLVRLAERAFDRPDSLGTPLALRARHADPVVLVPGFGCSASIFDALAAALRRDGFDVHIAQLSERGMGDLRMHAHELGAAVRHVQRTTGREQVDLLGLSSGGLVARTYVELLGGRDHVDAVTTLGTPNRGTGMASLFDSLRAVGGMARHVPPSLAQMRPGSTLLRALASVPPVALGARYTTIGARGFDGFVPAGSSTMDGARNIVLDDKNAVLGVSLRPNHYWLVKRSNEAYEAARHALLN